MTSSRWMNLLSRLLAASGALTLLFLLLLTTSGWALMAGYVPSDAEAFSSVLYMRQGSAGGPLLLSVHHYLASAVVVTAFLYLLATYLAGRHTSERVHWWSGTGAYLLLLGICFFGYLLPMDQKAYWGTVVRLGIVETMPRLGDLAATFLRGGEVFNASTLPRFYTLHVAVLPTLLLLAAWPLWRAVGRQLEDRRRLVRWLAASLAALAVVYLVAATLPAPLEIRGDPTDSEYVPRPEWYFLWLFQFGKQVESMPWIESLLLPLGGLLLLATLPFITRQRLAGRLALAGSWCALWLTLTALALHADRDLPPKLPYEQAMRLQAEQQYQALCAECHGEDGRGKGPQAAAFDLEVRDLTLAETWQQISAEAMRQAIRDGKGDDMPAFGRELAEEEIDAMMALLEQKFAPTPR